MDAAAPRRASAIRRARGHGRVTKASDLLVAALENEGVECIFAIPGEENLDVLESLRHSKIKLVLTRHEQAAGFMAATCGRLTGRAGVCLTTLGPGALNLTTAAAYAHLGAMPMVMITGQKAIRSSRQARFQIVDIVATMRPLTKMATQIVAALSIPTLVRDAFRVAHQRPVVRRDAVFVEPHFGHASRRIGPPSCHCRDHSRSTARPNQSFSCAAPVKIPAVFLSEQGKNRVVSGQYCQAVYATWVVRWSGAVGNVSHSRRDQT
jgi:2-succinyl-5-enolpyruvyl-6-hydroxy-3-cyclohexene-1-carboxylate synthase